MPSPILVCERWLLGELCRWIHCQVLRNFIRVTMLNLICIWSQPLKIETYVCDVLNSFFIEAKKWQKWEPRRKSNSGRNSQYARFPFFWEHEEGPLFLRRGSRLAIKWRNNVSRHKTSPGIIAHARLIWKLMAGNSFLVLCHASWGELADVLYILRCSILKHGLPTMRFVHSHNFQNVPFIEWFEWTAHLLKS